MHGNFALRVSECITEKVVEPGAVFVFLMGVGLIVTKGYNPLVELWVGLSIVLFLITLGFCVLRAAAGHPEDDRPDQSSLRRPARRDRRPSSLRSRPGRRAAASS